MFLFLWLIPAKPGDKARVSPLLLNHQPIHDFWGVNSPFWDAEKAEPSSGSTIQYCLYTA